MEQKTHIGSKKPGYRRQLGLFNLIMLNSMGMIGSGWLFASFYATSYAGPIGAIFAWVIGGGFVLIMALSYMEVSPMFPLAGGSTPLSEFSFGKMTGFLAGWSAWISDIMTPTIEAIALVTYASFYVKGLVNTHGVLLPEGYLVAIVAMIIIFIVNAQRVKIFGNITSGIMIWKYAVPVLAAIAILTFSFRPTNFVSFGALGGNGYSGIFYALVLGGIIFSFEGYRAAVNMAGEAAHRDYIWKSVVIALVLVIALYVLLQVAFVSGIVWSKLGIAPGAWGSLSSTALVNGPFAQEAAAVGLGWLVVILLIDSVISPGGAGISYSAYPARIFQSMAENGYAPKIFGKLHPKTNIPFNALVLGTVLGFAFLYEFPAWSLLVGILTSTLVVAYVIGPASINIFRRTVPNRDRPFRLRGANIIAPLGFIITFFVIYWSTWPLAGEVAAVVLVGLVMYFYFHIKNKFEMKHVTRGLWFAIGILAIAIESYIGPTQYGGLNIIKFPWDFILVAITGVVFYLWAQASGWETDSLKKYLAEDQEEL